MGYSEPGRGTSFKIYLPRVSETAIVEREKRPRVAASARGNGTILLAEDEKEVRAVAREFLELSGYTVLKAKDGAEAVELAAKHSGVIDLLVTDMVMPGMSGRELSARLTAMRAGIRVIYMSGTQNTPPCGMVMQSRTESCAPKAVFSRRACSHRA